MPVIKGFVAAPCPMWLLDQDNATIIPLARRDNALWSNAQANPLYNTPPDSSPPGMCLEGHCNRPLLGSHFRIATARGAHFLCAKVSVGDTFEQRGNELQVYINIWSGKSLERGCLYCALAYTPNCWDRCLCGGCFEEWLDWGWICPCFDIDTWLPY